MYCEHKGLKKATSTGCSRCVVWPGSDTVMAPLSRANCKASGFLVCVEWPFKCTRIFRLALGTIISAKSVSHFGNNLLRCNCFLGRMQHSLVGLNLWSRQILPVCISTSEVQYTAASRADTTDGCCIYSPIPLEKENILDLPITDSTLLGFFWTAVKPDSSKL
jgi:hypothetical protein